jgi:hypothetical protein
MSQITNMNDTDIKSEEKPEIKQFDDIHYPHYRENNTFISKENLFQLIITDLIEFIKTQPAQNELRIGYILYSKMSLNSSKMNNIFNLLLQKINPDIRVQSMWEVLERNKVPMQTEKGIQNMEIDKIRVKLLLRPNDKDIAIKKLAEINLNQMKKHNKKANEYLMNIQ